MNRYLALADSIGEVTASSGGRRVGAFFDLDGTLVDGFTSVAHARDRIRRRQASLGEMLGVVEASVRYRLGRMTFERLVVRAAGYLSGQTLDDLDELGEELFRRHNLPRVFPHMRAVVRAHQDQGHTVVLSSSAMTIHAEPVARYLGIGTVLCNHFQVDGGRRLTGDIVRPIIWGEQKAAAVERFCRAEDVALDRSFFYADGDEDTALMRLVGQPRPVNPRSGLAATAAQQGWPILRIAGTPRPGRSRALRQRGAVEGSAEPDPERNA